MSEVSADRIIFQSDGVALKGAIFRPQSLPASKGIIIFTHGLGYCPRQYNLDGSFFALNNFVFANYTLRGHAGSDGQWTLEKSVQDLKNYISYLQANVIQHDNVVVMGHSTGALISLLCAMSDRRVRSASIITVVTNLLESYRHWFKSGFNEEVKKYFTSKGVIPEIINRFMDDESTMDLFIRGSLDTLDMEIPHRYGMLKSKSFVNFVRQIAFTANILEETERISIPLIIFRGKEDEVMSPQKSSELHALIQAKTASELIITNSKNHFQDESWGLIQDETLRFANKAFLPHLV